MPKGQYGAAITCFLENRNKEASPFLHRCAAVPCHHPSTAIIFGNLYHPIFFFSQTHVCGAKARSDGPDHADSLSTTYVSRAKHFTCRLQRWYVHLDSGFWSMPLYVAAAP